MTDVQIVTMTPEWAAGLLQNNPENRNIRPTHVKLLAQDMQRGDWQFNGDAIRVNGDGSLIDGQHRLSACVKSGVPFQTIFITGLPNDVRRTIDGGARRTNGDRLSMRGVANANTLASSLRFLAAIAGGTLTASTHLTPSEADRIFSAHPGISHSVTTARSAFPGIGSLLSAVHYIGGYIGSENAADEFVEVWRSGVPAYKGDPAHMLRERVIRTASTGDKITSRSMQPLMIGAWRNFQSRTSVSRVLPARDLRIPGWGKDDLGC